MKFYYEAFAEVTYEIFTLWTLMQHLPVITYLKIMLFTTSLRIPINNMSDILEYLLYCSDFGYPLNPERIRN